MSRRDIRKSAWWGRQGRGEEQGKEPAKNLLVREERMAQIGDRSCK